MVSFNIPYISGGELAVLKQVIQNKKFAGGGVYASKLKDLIARKYGFNNVFLTASCTSAIELCTQVISLKAGDEVIIPSYTFASTPNPFLKLGAKIIFADCKPDYPNISISSVISKITDKTKVIMVMHYGGVNDDVEELAEICRSRGIFLIEDAAHAIDSVNEKGALGSFGDFSVFSFHDTKNITCGEGGMLVVNNKKYSDQVEQVYEYGTNRANFIKGIVPSYEWVSNGMSCKMSEFSAAILYDQLASVGEVTQNRRTTYQAYANQLSKLNNDLVKVPQLETTRCNYHNFFILVKKKGGATALINYMEVLGVKCAAHYFPLHESRFAKANGLTGQDLENASYFGEHLVRLPLYVGLSSSKVNNITQLIREFFEGDQ
jgi:dTDP-4-amino-4,6-dideoxygalactose transaminase